ncbi:MAG: hypothetical protein Q9173_007359, partial [Seirophora scorigena]
SVAGGGKVVVEVEVAEEEEEEEEEPPEGIIIIVQIQFSHPFKILQPHFFNEPHPAFTQSTPRLLKLFYHPPMSRTVADATRFTATSPHAYSRPSSILRSANATFSPSSYSASGSAASQWRKPPPLPNKPPSQQQPPSNAPQHETPEQKVARLRALRAAEKLKPLSLWDRTVVRGRRWADVAHRTTALGLMGVTLLAGVITAFSLTDMLIYNRNQRRLFYATQAAIYTETLQSAIEAEQTGRALTDEESSVLNREKAVLAAEAAREKRSQASWTTRAKQFFLGVDEQGGEKEK